MGPLSTTRPVLLTPTGQEGVAEEKTVAYQIKVPGIYDRAAYRRQVKARGARLWFPGDVRRAMASDIATAQGSGAFTQPQGKAAEETLKAFEAALDDQEGAENPEPIDEKLLDAFSGFEDAVRAMGGEYAGRLADNEYYFEIAMIEAVRLFVIGWQNVDAEFVRSEPQGLAEETLALIPDDHLRQLDARIADLLSPSRGAEKNSRSPSPGPSGQKTSPAASTSRKKTRRASKTSGRSRKLASKG